MAIPMEIISAIIMRGESSSNSRCNSKILAEIIQIELLMKVTTLLLAILKLEAVKIKKAECFYPDHSFLITILVITVSK